MYINQHNSAHNVIFGEIIFQLHEFQTQNKTHKFNLSVLHTSRFLKIIKKF